MHAAVKLIFGLILILIGLWLLVPVDSVLSVVKPAAWARIGGVSLDWWDEFTTIVKGIIPPMVIILGILIVWIEGEELKAPVVPEPKVEPITKPAKKAVKKKKPKRKK